MKVIDLMIRLQDLPPDMEIMIDVTKKDSVLFNFKEIVFVDEIETGSCEEIVLISNRDFNEEDESIIGMSDN